MLIKTLTSAFYMVTPIREATFFFKNQCSIGLQVMEDLVLSRLYSILVVH